MGFGALESNFETDFSGLRPARPRPVDQCARLTRQTTASMGLAKPTAGMLT